MIIDKPFWTFVEKSCFVYVYSIALLFLEHGLAFLCISCWDCVTRCRPGWWLLMTQIS